jgi:hypothetical protein
MTRFVASTLVLILLAGCGEGGSESGGGIDSPCDLTDAAQVESVFGPSVSEGVEGEARNCSFEHDPGPVTSISVYYFGDADGWDGTRSGFEDNRGGTTDVSGIGDEAFHPNDTGPAELVVSAGGEIFAITVFSGLVEDPDPSVADDVAELATLIANDLGS